MKRYPTHRHCAGVVAFLLAMCFAHNSYSQLTGDPRLLSAVVAKHRANRESINTWRGKATIRRQMEGESDVKSVDVTFYCDAKRDYFRWTWMPEQRLRDTERVVNGLIRDGRAYRLASDSIVKATGEKHAGLVVVPVDKVSASRRTDAYFNPIWYATSLYGDARLDEIFDYVHQEAENPKNDWSVRKQGDIVTLEYVKGKVINRYSVDLTKGANLVTGYFSEPTPGHITTYEVSWQQVHGVWIPLKQHSSIPLNEAKGIRIARRTIEWNENVLNEPIEEHTFSPESLPLQPGDSINDVGSGISYEYKASQAAVERISGEKPHARRHWFLFGSLGIIVPLSGYLWWRRASRA